MSDRDRLAHQLLERIEQLLPESKGLQAYNRNIVCPAEAINVMLDELEEKFTKELKEKLRRREMQLEARFDI